MTTLNFLFKLEDILNKRWREENNKEAKEYPSEEEMFEFVERKLRNDRKSKKTR